MSMRSIPAVALALAPLIFFSLILSAPLATALASPFPVDDVPAEVRGGIEGALKEKLAAVSSEKNDKGALYKRAFYSRIFHRVDDSTYQVGWHVNTALLDNEVVERYVLTLTKVADGWSITNEELEETFKGLYRGILGDETCSHFATFTLENEGLSLKATNGNFCRDYLQGKTSRIWVAADDLAYSYTPPVPRDFSTYKLLQKEKGNDLVFEPEHAVLTCDPRTCEEFLKKGFTGVAEIKRAEAGQVLQRVLDEGTREAEKSLQENPFWAFRRPYEEDRKSYYIGLKRQGMEDHWLGMGYDSYDPKEVGVYVSGYFGIPLYLYHSEETRKSGITPHDLERRPDADARDFEVAGLEGTVEMGFGEGESLVGDLTYSMKTKRALKELPFSISRLRAADEKKETKNPNLRINALQDGAGNDLTWVRTGLFSGLVIFPQTLAAGADLTLRLQFESKDSIYKLTPAFSYVDRGGWLPFVRFADMINTFDLTVKVPARYKTLGIGRMASETKVGGANITRWVADSPVSFPTVIFGQYIESASTFPAKKKDGTVIPVRSFVDKDSMGMHEISPKNLTKFANDAANALNLYSEIFGVDYPYSKLDLVNDPSPALYGQAPSSLIYLGSAAYFGKGLLESSNDRGGLSTFVDSLVAHETAHQWWGSLICNSNQGNYWFVESLAEYSSALFTENVYGYKAYLKHVGDWRDEILKADLRGAVQDNYTTWQGPGGFGAFRAAIYAKGPYAFHILRSTFGDEAFFKFLKNLAQELKGKEIVTRDIQVVAEKSFQMKMDWFFNQWLRGVGLPQFTFTYTTRKAEDGSYLIEGEILQKVLLKPAISTKEELEGVYFEGVVPIYVTTRSGKEMKKRVIVKGPKTPFQWSLPEEPKEITLNKNLDSLAYDIILPIAGM